MQCEHIFQIEVIYAGTFMKYLSIETTLEDNISRLEFGFKVGLQIKIQGTTLH